MPEFEAKHYHIAFLLLRRLQELHMHNTHHLDRQKKVKKCEHIGKAIFDIPFMIQSHAESVKKILGLAVLVSW
jgi:hypothetical protein